MSQNRIMAAAVGAYLLTMAGDASAAPDESALPPPTGAEFKRLQQEVADQRQLIIQMMNSEQQRHDLLLKLIQTGGGGHTTVPKVSGAPEARSKAGADEISPATKLKQTERTATLTGKVEAPGGDLSDVYVYVLNAKAAPVRGRTINIEQREKQFVPAVSVVQRGTTVTFPNRDAVFHNVFSPSPGQPFDLGSYRAGETPRAVKMTSPGVVDIYCNMHSKMTAKVLVVPNSLFARVAPDGTFRLEGVPIGSRKIAAWSPRTKPTQQNVEVGVGGAEVKFSLEAEVAKPHNNKLGLPYSSYKE